ncbi:PEP-CTERM sorting domain-containing protein [Thiobacillus sp.]|uniref:PEP-CTERM sorting domain-containing protein n=1 Tax=Thiobacillus sp. TaxID=924 RepID=UPI0025F3B474|nr:PEP-CTERM sorting domain-containing protein [Thiobacillus sp.]MBT9538315.1 PEP-CTERM sorting domain-containing protein [Thiobacillus sp.]
MKLKLIALAAMLAAGSAQAAIDTGTLSGNGELLLNLKWKDTALTDGNQSASAAFDLGITLDYAAANFNTAGFSQSWDLSSYGNQLATFTGTTNLNIANAEMNVFAIDGSGTNPGDIRLVSTTGGISATGSALSLTAASIPNNGTLNSIPGNVTVVNFFAAVNGSSSHSLVANGASNADASSGAAWFDNGTGMDKFGNQAIFDTTGKFDGSYAAGTGVLAGQAKALPFYMVTTSSDTPTDKATMSAFGFDVDGDGVVEFDNNGALAGGTSEIGLWTLQGNTLTYSVAAAVPEAETYAMMLAGLGLVGFMVRRRRNAI